MSGTLRVAADVGGTFTDIACLSADGELSTCKIPSTPDDYAQAIIEGDATVPAISAASILAKTCRDAMMRNLDVCYPGFHLSVHKGYGTPQHLEALRERAPSPLHRLSFTPVRIALETLTVTVTTGEALTGTDDGFI